MTVQPIGRRKEQGGNETGYVGLTEHANRISNAARRGGAAHQSLPETLRQFARRKAKIMAFPPTSIRPKQLPGHRVLIRPLVHSSSRINALRFRVVRKQLAPIRICFADREVRWYF
ncbi:MAG: hypothetical protein WCS70_16180 [Verrucomicrobiota bacterium]